MDALNFMLCLDQQMSDDLESISPYKSGFDLLRPFSVSNDLTLSKTVSTMITNWLHYSNDEIITTEQINFTKSLYI